MEIIGTKYQTYINDELVILRLFKINRNKNSNKYEYILLDDNNNKVKIISKEELNKFVILAPDAVMNIMETDSNGHKDIFVCCQKADKLSQPAPDLILRQDVYSYTKNWSPENNNIFVGDCLTTNTAPSYKDFTDLMEFDEIINSDSVVLYIPEEKILFLGDSHSKDLYTYPWHFDIKKEDKFMEEVDKIPYDLIEKERYIEALKTLDFTIAIPGHSESMEREELFSLLS